MMTPTNLRVNFVIAGVTIATCLLLPLVVELQQSSSDDAASKRDLANVVPRSRDDERHRLYVPSLDISIKNLSTSSERIETSRRVKFWLQNMNLCTGALSQSPSGAVYCGGRSPHHYVSAAQLLLALVQNSGAAATVSAVVSSWYGAVPLEILQLSRRYAQQSSIALRVLAIGGVGCRAVIRDKVWCKEDSLSSCGCVEPNDQVVAENETFVSRCTGPKAPECNFLLDTPDMGHVRQHDVREWTSVAVVLLDMGVVSSSSLGVRIILTAIAVLQTGSPNAMLLNWRQQGRMESSSVALLVSGMSQAALEMRLVHGDCDTTAADAVQAFTSLLQDEENSAQLRTCLVLLRSQRAASTVSFTRLIQLASETPLPRGTENRDMSARAHSAHVSLPASGASSLLHSFLVGAFLMLAVCVGAVLCLGISKSWRQRSRRQRNDRAEA